MVFTRVWWIYELHLILTNSQEAEEKEKEESEEELWAIYTAKKHTYNFYEKRDAVGIISGGATSDGGNSDRITDREKFFPYELIKKSLAIRVEDAEASVK